MEHEWIRLTCDRDPVWVLRSSVQAVVQESLMATRLLLHGGQAVVVEESAEHVMREVWMGEMEAVDRAMGGEEAG